MASVKNGLTSMKKKYNAVVEDGLMKKVKN